MSPDKKESFRLVPGQKSAKAGPTVPSKSDPGQADKDKSQKPSVILKKKLPGGTAKAQKARRPKPGRGKSARPATQKGPRPGFSKDAKRKPKDTAKEIPEKLLQMKPEDIKIPVGILMISLTGIIAEKRHDERCLATKKEVQWWEDLFNAWIDYRLPVLMKYAPDLALLVPWVAYFQRISTLPARKTVKHDTEA